VGLSLILALEHAKGEETVQSPFFQYSNQFVYLRLTTCGTPFEATIALAFYHGGGDNPTHKELR
jgi:hypothetical protein